MDKAPVSNSGLKKKTGIGIKHSKRKGGGKKQVRPRKKHGTIQNQPTWKPFMA